MQFDKGSLSEYLKTRFYAPAWWVNAFDSMLQAEYAVQSWEQIPALGVGPAFDLQELYLFPLVISHVQRELMQTGSTQQIIHLDPNNIEKEAGIYLHSRKKYLKQLLASLGSVKLYHKSASGYDVQTLFSFESWRKIEEGMHLVLGLQPFATEAFTGFISAYKEVKRSLGGQLRLRQIMGCEAPLVLWRSLWHEAQGIEQLVLLRMEKAVQWSFNCLNLEGVFGESVPKIFEGVRDQNKQNQTPSLTRMVSIIHRLSRKLADHGSVCKPLEGDYLAFNEREPLLQLLWKVSPNHFQGEDFRVFTKAVFEKLKKDQAFLSDIHNSLTCLDDRSQKEANDKNQYEKILGSQALLEQDPGLDSPEYWLIDNNVLLPLVGLYWEWVVRKDRKHPFQVPDELRLTELFYDLPDLNVDLEKHNEHYRRFQKQISEKDLYKDAVSRVPGACLASLESAAILEKLGLRGLKSSKWEHSKSSDLVNNKMESVKKVKSNLNSKTAEHAVQDSKSAPLAPKKPATKGKKDHSSDKEDVVEVLNRMKKNSRESYLKLTKLYLESLDQGARQLILEIKNRMQPQVFEQHIQHRLVRFMLERPSAWQNLSTP
ncbi:MAG: hypothetical protein AB8G05_12660 [Oligoflexales bacterium]